MQKILLYILSDILHALTRELYKWILCELHIRHKKKTKTTALLSNVE